MNVNNNQMLIENPQWLSIAISKQEREHVEESNEEKEFILLDLLPPTSPLSFGVKLP
jgi:hypothetical protein